MIVVLYLFCIYDCRTFSYKMIKTVLKFIVTLTNKFVNVRTFYNIIFLIYDYTILLFQPSI